MLTHKKPFVSVVIPTLNEEKYLSRCLESFQKQIVIKGTPVR